MDLHTLHTKFKTEQDCHNFLQSIRWSNGAECTFCNSKKVYKRKTSYRLKCRNCNKSFSVTSGTIFHSSRIPLMKWFLAIVVISNAKKGISSLQLARTINVNKNTSWYLQHRLRKAMKEDYLLKGLIEVDETYIGGKLGNMSYAYKQKRNPHKSGMVHMSPVLGILQRNGKIILKALDHANGQNIKPLLYNCINPESKVITDGFGGYFGIGKTFERHIKLNHEKRQMKWGRYHLSNIEGFFSTIKRAVIGQYHIISKFHIQNYMDEIAFKKNHSPNEIFYLLLSNCLTRCR